MELGQTCLWEGASVSLGFNKYNTWEKETCHWIICLPHLGDTCNFRLSICVFYLAHSACLLLGIHCQDYILIILVDINISDWRYLKIWKLRLSPAAAGWSQEGTALLDCECALCSRGQWYIQGCWLSVYCGTTTLWGKVWVLIFYGKTLWHGTVNDLPKFRQCCGLDLKESPNHALYLEGDWTTEYSIPL